MSTFFTTEQQRYSVSDLAHRVLTEKVTAEHAEEIGDMEAAVWSWKEAGRLAEALRLQVQSILALLGGSQ